MNSALEPHTHSRPKTKFYGLAQKVPFGDRDLPNGFLTYVLLAKLGTTSRWKSGRGKSQDKLKNFKTSSSSGGVDGITIS